MKEWELFEALGDLDDELITQERPTRPRWKRGGLRLALIAAVTALLVGTALGVGLRVGVTYGRETIPLDGISLGQKDGKDTRELSYYTAEIQYELQTVCVENLELLSSQLTRAWEDYGQFKTAELMGEDGKRRNLGTIAGAEEFFGLDLMQSPDLEALVRGAYVTMVISDPERAEAEYAETGKVTPDGLMIYFSLRRGEASTEALDGRLVSESGITVYIALTEAFIAQEGGRCLYSHESEGEFQESGLMTDRGKSLLLLENTLEGISGQTGYAAWCHQGIGYLAHIKTYPSSQATPLSLLAPVLQKMQ